MPDRTLGQAAYEAYWAAHGHLFGTATWVRLDAKERAAWEAAATAAVEACGGDQ